jgi:methionine-rich copper-binding protein CopC
MKKTVITLFALVTILLSPTAAFAHAGVVATVPVQDQVLMSMVREISVQFSEELLTISDKEVNTISLTELDGPAIELENVRVDGEYLKAEIPIGDYLPGTYEVTYRVVSADGHQVSDSFTFSLNAPVVTSAPSIADSDDGLLPAPILIAIAILLLLGGFFALRSQRK